MIYQGSCYEKLGNYQFFDPLGSPNDITHKYELRPKIKNLLSHVCLSHQMHSKNGMSHPGGTKNPREDAVLVNGPFGGQVEAVGPQGEVV